MTDITESLTTRVCEAIRQLRDLPDELESEDIPTFTVEQLNFLEKRFYEIRAILDSAEPFYASSDLSLYVHDLLAKHRQIAAIWAVEDVKDIRPHLTDDQAWDVLQQVGHDHDAEWGISWTTLETVADMLFPEPAKDEEAKP